MDLISARNITALITLEMYLSWFHPELFLFGACMVFCCFSLKGYHTIHERPCENCRPIPQVQSRSTLPWDMLDDQNLIQQQSTCH